LHYDGNLKEVFQNLKKMLLVTVSVSVSSVTCGTYTEHFNIL